MTDQLPIITGTRAVNTTATPSTSLIGRGLIAIQRREACIASTEKKDVGSLKPSMSAHSSFESLADTWNSNGRPPKSLINGLPLLSLIFWESSVGAKADGISESLRDFLNASLAEQPPNWYRDRLNERHLNSCKQCDESYRLENLMLCTHCYQTYCYRCKGGKFSVLIDRSRSHTKTSQIQGFL